MSISSLPSDYQLSNCIALYMRQQFFSEAFPEECHQTPTPFDLHMDTTIGIHSIVSTMVDAYHNPVQSNVDHIRLEESVSRNESGLDLEQEDQFLITYPPNALGVLDHPAVILGWDDVIALWYLPSALSQSTKNTILHSIPYLQQQLETSITGHTWRRQMDWFNQSNAHLAGCLEFALARHMLGHEMQFDTLGILKNLNTDASLEWLQAMAVPNAMISSVLSIIHPPLYKAGIEGIEKLKTETALNNPVMDRALMVWPTAFTNISLISNRACPLHCDPHSSGNWYDITANVGDHSSCIMSIPTLGLELVYDPGMVVAFSRHLL
ncbi:hypothetical protein EDC04DRAFT_2893336 [Pisolithus marmoratus]|nr:hypothetical protein EDC04DRAFT_2893336 [Pisolithus marmoratus]